MTPLVKFVHLGAIGVWSAGLLVLPYLFWQRRFLPVAGLDVDRLDRLTRFVYVAMASPAAALAITTGTALIFLQGTFVAWFSLKMLLVGAMVMLHVVAGLTVSSIFTPGARRYGLGANAMLTTAYGVLIVTIIWVVLAKPPLNLNLLAPAFFEPGSLRHFFVGDTRTPMP